MCGSYRSNTKSRSKSKAHLISPKQRLDIYKYHEIYCKDYHNLCLNCYQKDIETLTFQTYVSEKVELPTYIAIVLKQLVKQHKDNFRDNRKQKAYIHYEDITNDDHYILTGLQIEEKNNLIQRIEENRNKSDENEIQINPQHLLLFLTLIYQGICQSLTGVLFGYAKCSIGRIMKSVADVLIRLYVPTELGFSAWNRQKILENIPSYVKTLFPNDNVVAIADGGYIEIGKTSHFENQRRTFCSYKHVNCLKPMVVSTMNGKIINVYGFFYSDNYNNDSNIWDVIVNNTDN